MYTLACVLTPLVLGTVFGLPLTCVLRRRSSIEKQDWLLSPFVGSAAVIVVLHNLVYHDITVAAAAPWFWAVALCGWLAMIWRYGAQELLRSFPTGPMLMCAAVYGVCLLGLLKLGAQAYLGRAHSDTYNYTVIAQFLADVPFSTGWADAGQRPWLTKVLLLKDDRIGMMLLHGFASASIGVPAQHLLGAVLLLSAPLMSLAVYLLLQRLGGDSRLSLAASAIAGLLPGFAVVHASGFLAQATGQSFLLVAVLLLHESASSRQRGAWILTALILAGTTALYTEFTLLVAVLLVAAFVCGVLLRSIHWRSALVSLMVLAVAWLAAIPEFLPGMWRVINRVAHPTANGHPLGWIPVHALSGVVWFPDYVILGKPKGLIAALVIGYVLTGAAFWGWYKLLQLNPSPTPSDESDNQRRRSHRLMKLACFSLLLIPFASLMGYERHPYQVFKLVLGFSPLLSLGFAVFWSQDDRWRQVQRVATGMLLVAVGGGAAMIATRDGSAARPKRGEATARHEAHRPDRLAVQEKLEQLHDEDVVLAGGRGVFYNGWFSYAARRNRVWLVNPIESGFAVGCKTSPTPRIRALPLGEQFVDLSRLPDRVLVLSDGQQIGLTGNPRRLWSSGEFTLWEVRNPTVNLQPTELACRNTLIAAQVQKRR